MHGTTLLTKEKLEFGRVAFDQGREDQSASELAVQILCCVLLLKTQQPNQISIEVNSLSNYVWLFARENF